MNLGVWIAIGIGLGMAIGAAIENIGIGVAIGIALGVVLGGVVHWWSTRRDRRCSRSLIADRGDRRARELFVPSTVDAERNDEFQAGR